MYARDATKAPQQCRLSVLNLRSYTFRLAKGAIFHFLNFRRLVVISLENEAQPNTDNASYSWTIPGLVKAVSSKRFLGRL